MERKGRPCGRLFQRLGKFVLMAVSFVFTKKVFVLYCKCGILRNESLDERLRFLIRGTYEAI